MPPVRGTTDSTQWTSSPWRRKCSQKWRPTNPAPPVIRILRMYLCFLGLVSGLIEQGGGQDSGPRFTLFFFLLVVAERVEFSGLLLLLPSQRLNVPAQLAHAILRLAQQLLTVVALGAKRVCDQVPSERDA